MNRKIASFVAAIALSSVLGCSGQASVTASNPLPGIQAYFQSLRASGSAKTAVETTKTDPKVQQQSAPDLQPYRSEFDATVNAWIVYYYSPSQQKSYVCRPQADKSVIVTQVTDVNLIYQEGNTIDTTKVNVEAAAAAETAVQEAQTTTASPSPSPSATPTAAPTAATSPGATAAPAASPTMAPTAAPTTGGNTTVVNNTTVVVQNVYLISAGELKKKHGRNSDNPCYVVVTNNQPIYIDASTGKTINASGGAAVSTGSGSATATGGTTTGTTGTTTGGTVTGSTGTASPAASASPM